MCDGKVDNVNHPSHYESSTSIECIDAMRIALGPEAVIDFCLGNAFKYLWRCKNKGSFYEDLEKCKWYIEHGNELITEVLEHDKSDAVVLLQKRGTFREILLTHDILHSQRTVEIKFNKWLDHEEDGDDSVKPLPGTGHYRYDEKAEE